MPEEKMAPAPKPAPAGGTSSDDNLFGALCYIIAVLVPLFVLFSEKKTNKFLVFHSWQSLILSVIWFVIWFGYSVVTTVLSVVTYGIGSLLWCISAPLFLVMALTILLPAYKAYLGERYKLPAIGDFAEKQAMK